MACIEALKPAPIWPPKKCHAAAGKYRSGREPEYYLTSVAEGFEIIRKVDNPHAKFLYDFYHEQYRR